MDSPVRLGGWTHERPCTCTCVHAFVLCVQDITCTRSCLTRVQEGLEDAEERLGVEIVRKALQAPARRIAENAGVEGEVRLQMGLGVGVGGWVQVQVQVQV